MKVEEIPANELVVMTPELYQQFAQKGCVPKCHLTGKWINMGDKFKLTTIDTHSHDGNILYGMMKTIDVMLAENSDPKDYIAYHKKRLKDIEAIRKKDKENGHTGCFRINGKIVV
jgi:hypothetical protein